jgi:hypothetical protein
MILFKENQAKELKVEFTQIEPVLRKLLIEMAQWVTSKGHKFVITDLLSEKLEDEKLKRVSKSHQEGRAADIRVRDWPKDFRKLFEEYFEKRYSHIAAISKKSGKPNLIEIHDNGIGGIHCHIQVRKQKKD